MKTDRIQPVLSKPRIGQKDQQVLGGIATILATGYLRLLGRYGPNWLERLELRRKVVGEDSLKKSSNRLDFSANKSMKYAGERSITLTLTRS